MASDPSSAQTSQYGDDNQQPVIPAKMPDQSPARVDDMQVNTQPARVDQMSVSTQPARTDQMQVTKDSPQQVAQQLLAQKATPSTPMTMGQKVAKGLKAAGNALTDDKAKQPQQPQQPPVPQTPVPVIHTDTYARFSQWMNQQLGQGIGKH